METLIPFLQEVGELALGTRLKALSDFLYDAVDEVYRRERSPFQARWFPVVRLLHDRGPRTVTGIAREVGLTHAAVSQLAGKLIAEGWLRATVDPEDGRQRYLSLTPLALDEVRRLRSLWWATREVLADRLTQTGVDVLAVLCSLEQSLSAGTPLPEAIAAKRPFFPLDAVTVVPFEPALRSHFYRLNAEWLKMYFYVEEIDHQVLSEPEQQILKPGGAIFFALVGDEVVGTCALRKERPGCYELTKMAVTETRRGLGVGRKLLAAALKEFQSRAGKELFLESNSKLTTALRLYESVGFRRQPGKRPGSHYQRADVYMIWHPPRRAKSVSLTIPSCHFVDLLDAAC